MRKFLFIVSLLAVTSLALVACGGNQPSTSPLSAEDLVATLTAMPTNTPLPTATIVPTRTPLPTATLVPSVLDEGMPLRTAEDLRTLFDKVNGWVSGGEGKWVAGAQGALAKDLVLKDLPEGATFEFQCVQYHTLDSVVVIKKVCPGATISFSETIPAGSIGTMWLNWPVQGSENETWKEGFLNKPCPCANGDCRKP